MYWPVLDDVDELEILKVDRDDDKLDHSAEFHQDKKSNYR